METSSRSRRTMVAATAALTVIGAVAAVLLLPRILAPVPEAPFLAAALVVGSVLLGLGGYLTFRRPRLPFGALVAATGAVLMVVHLAPDPPPPALEGTWMLLYLPLALILVRFPTGRPGTRGWAWASRSVVAVVVLFNAACLLVAAAPAIRPVLEPVGFLLVFLFLIALVRCCAAPLARYPHSPAVQRLRLRWMFVAGLALPATLLLCWASYLVLGVPDLVVVGLLVSYALIPAGAVVGLLRPTWFDVDRATVAATTGTVLAAGALCLVSAAVWAAGVRLVEWSPPVAVGSVTVLAAAAAIAYPRLRDRLEQVLYPQRARAMNAVEVLAAAVEAGTARPEDLQQQLRSALGDPRLVVAYRGMTDPLLRGLDRVPVSVNTATGVVRLAGEDIGAIVPVGALTPVVPAAVCRAAAPLVALIRSRAEIAHAVAEVERARELMLLAGDRERRRLERDLHDGAQQRLVALGMRLRVLQRTGTTSPTGSQELDAVVAELATAVAELRQVARGVRPSALDAGLPAALGELARQDPGRITLDVDATALPDVVALTAYFVVTEAVTNALRHTTARRIHVSLRREGPSVTVSVSDDGHGGARLLPRGGLAGLTDRVAGSGGRLDVTSVAGRGTTVRAVLPCGS